MWQLNNTLLNNTGAKAGMKRGRNENDQAACQKVWDSAKAVTGGKFISLQAHLKKQEKSQISQHFTIKNWKRTNEANKRKKSKNYGRIKQNTEQKDNRKNNAAKGCFFENINNVDKSLTH